MMINRKQSAVLGLVVLAASVASWAAGENARSGMMPVSELKPGMKGYGLTVFKGTEPERFEVEVVGVRGGAIGAGVDMILIRMTHPILEDIGVVGGMSGSPVFIEDRLIGAVAYGYTYSKVALGGVTPIENMMDVFDRTTKEPPPRDIALGPVEQIRFGEPVSFEPKFPSLDDQAVVIPRDGLPVATRAFLEPGQDEIRMEPLRAPLVASACSPQTARLIERLFQPMGIEPIFAPMGTVSGAGGAKSAIPIKNGSAVGIPYIMGDVNLGTIGTATYVKGNKLVAFGHPWMATGPVEFPLGAAHIQAVMPSLARPFKLGDIVGLSGSIYQDRLTAVGGVVGRVPNMVPLTVKVTHESNKTDRTYRYRIIDHRIYTPRMATIALQESISSAERLEGYQTANIQYRIETDDGRVIEKSDMATGSVAPLSLSMLLMSDLAPIYSNDFQVRSVKKISAEVRLRDGVRLGRINSAFVDRPTVKPGQTLRISAYVQRWRKPQQRITATLQVPPDLADGQYNLVIADSRQRLSADLSRAPGIYRPRDFAGVIRLLDIHYPPDRLYVFITSTKRGITIDGSEFASLPPSIDYALGSLNDREKITPTLGKIVAESTSPVPFVLSGGTVTPIQVDRRGGR